MLYLRRMAVSSVYIAVLLHIESVDLPAASEPCITAMSRLHTSDGAVGSWNISTVWPLSRPNAGAGAEQVFARVSRARRIRNEICETYVCIIMD